MKEHPILFSAPMVRAILEGRKTQTRRVIKPQPDYVVKDAYFTKGLDVPRRGNDIRCPYGQPGDRLWVLEAHAIVPRTAYAMSDGAQQTLRPDDDHDAAIYREGWERSTGGFRWRPSILMPRWASRILLEVVSVRAERLQEISEADAIAEGVEPVNVGDELFMDYLNGKGRACTAGCSFASLWQSINGPKSWDANPWVWVVEFRRVQP